MRILTASVSAFAAAALVAGAGASASACEFHMQTTAQVSTPAPVEEQVVEATEIDPVLLAYLKRAGVNSDDTSETAQAE